MVINKRLLSLALSLLGILGVGGTAYVAVKCSKKAEEKTETKEKILAYAPAIVAGVGTSAAILGSHYVSRQEIMALTATCTYLASNREKIEAKVREKFGADKLVETKKEIALAGTPWDNVEWNGKVTIENTGTGRERFLDWFGGRQFYSSYENVMKGIKKLNYRFHNGEYVSYNDLYEEWGISKTQLGETFGWPANEDYIDYDIDNPIPFDIVHLNPGKEDDMYVIQYTMTPPMEAWMEV